jgi:hypothetical protein
MSSDEEWDEADRLGACFRVTRSSPGSSRPEGVQRASKRREYTDLRHPHSLYVLLSCTATMKTGSGGRLRATITDNE